MKTVSNICGQSGGTTWRAGRQSYHISVCLCELPELSLHIPLWQMNLSFTSSSVWLIHYMLRAGWCRRREADFPVNTWALFGPIKDKQGTCWDMVIQFKPRMMAGPSYQIQAWDLGWTMLEKKLVWQYFLFFEILCFVAFFYYFNYNFILFTSCVIIFGSLFFLWKKVCLT